MIEIDIERALSLVHEPDSPTYGDELTRRINAYNKLRVRDMDYILETIRYNGLTDEAYKLFSSELGNLPEREAK